jgi:hypothetical protein
MELANVGVPQEAVVRKVVLGATAVIVLVKVPSMFNSGEAATSENATVRVITVALPGRALTFTLIDTKFVE